MPPEAAAPAGWYPDPRSPDQARYWDGQQWSEQTRQVKGQMAPRAAQPTQPVAPVLTSQAAASPVPVTSKSQPAVEEPVTIESTPFAMSVSKDKGFFKSLFDFSFTSMVTPKIVKVLYGIAIFFISLGTIAVIISAFSSSTALGVVAFFILGPLYFLLNLLAARVFMEFLIVIFRILDTNRELVDIAKRG